MQEIVTMRRKANAPSSLNPYPWSWWVNAPTNEHSILKIDARMGGNAAANSVVINVCCKTGNDVAGEGSPVQSTNKSHPLEAAAKTG